MEYVIKLDIMGGLFGNLFDFNHDGKLDTFERAAELYVNPEALTNESIKIYVNAMKAIFNKLMDSVRKSGESTPKTICWQLIVLSKEIINSLKFVL